MMNRKAVVKQLVWPAHIGVQFSLIVGLSIGGVALYVGASQSMRPLDVDPYAEFCLPAPAAAQVPAGLKPSQIVFVDVPNDAVSDIATGRPSLPVSLRKGDVIEFRVSTPRAGALAVHGLTEIVRVAAGDHAITVRFRAIYSGRFPLHFHGPDRSHLEVAVLEVRD